MIKLLQQQINETCAYAETLVEEQFGKEIAFVQTEKVSELKPLFAALKEVINPGGKIPALTRVFHKEYIAAHESVKINGQFA